MDGGDPLDRLEVTLGSEFSFYLQFTMPNTFSGHLKRLILFTFEVAEPVQLLVSKTTTLKMGVVVLGSIIPRGVDRSLKASDRKEGEMRVEEGRKKLSVEAKVFAPVAAITHFDTPVSRISCLLTMCVLWFVLYAKFFMKYDTVHPDVFICWFVLSLMIHKFSFAQCNLISVATSPFPFYDAFRPPPNYTAVLNHPTLLKGAGFAEQLAQELHYLHHLRANTLEHVMQKLELCTIGDLIDKHSLSSALSYQYCQDILSNHVKLVNLEEIQTKIDIAQFDLHYVRLTAKIKPSAPNVPANAPGSQLLIAKLKIRGSSENRPKIGLGTEILLRPVQEDLYLLAQYHLLPQMFEIRGVCIHYQLSTEEATFEFPGMINPPQVPFLLLFSALRYHVRFDYERYGFLFIQWAVGSIMSNKYLVEALFPNDDTMLRLKAYFKSSRAPPAPPGLVQNSSVSATNVLRTTSSSNTMSAIPKNGSQQNTLPLLSQSNPNIPSANHRSSPDLASLINSTTSMSVEKNGDNAAAVTTSFNPQQLKAITTIGMLAADERYTEVSDFFFYCFQYHTEMMFSI